MTQHITNQDRAAIRRIFEKVRAATDPMVAAKAKRAGGLGHPMMPEIIAAQNTAVSITGNAREARACA